MDSLHRALLQVDWETLDHAHGPASDAPGQLLALVGDDPQSRSGAVGYLDAAMLHQGTVCSATGPFIAIVAGLLGDPRTAVSVADVLPWDAAATRLTFSGSTPPLAPETGDSTLTPRRERRLQPPS
jgi:hypothetical protein